MDKVILLALSLVLVDLGSPRKIRARIKDNRWILDDPDHSLSKELYMLAAYGKGTMSRGYANWYERHFVTGVPDSLAEHRRWKTLDFSTLDRTDREETVLMEEEALFLSESGIVELLDPIHVSQTRYRAYCYYKERGWIVKDGSRLGCDFTLYPSNPMHSHASYAVIVLDSGRMTSQWLLSKTRVNVNVKKAVIVCVVDERGIFERQVERWVPDKDRTLS
ncbi:tRNA intron endonuclease [Gorgonomyces haynaldii]|nr:tRNA intron endonuclease [Gorgonomyces haynaldii]